MVCFKNQLKSVFFLILGSFWGRQRAPRAINTDSSWVFDRSLVEAVQGIALSSVQKHFMYHLLNFRVFHHVLTYLRIVSNHIRVQIFKTSLNMFEESYQITSEILKLQNKSEHVCRIVSNHIRIFQNFKTNLKNVCRVVSNHIRFFQKFKRSLNMFEESYQITS